MLSKSRLKEITALKRKKFRFQRKRFLIEGVRLCNEAMRSDFAVETFIFCRKGIEQQKIDGLLQIAQEKGIEVIEITENHVNNLADTVHSQGVFCIVRQQLHQFKNLSNKKIIVIVDSVQDPGNLGTLIRTCDWFGVDALLLSNGSVELYNPKVVRSTMGSIFHLPIVEQINLQKIIQELKSDGFQIYAAHLNGQRLSHQVQYKTPLALILGNENRGIESSIEQLIDFSVKIQSYGEAESLNLAVAGAILINTIKNQIESKKFSDSFEGESELQQ